MKTRGLTSPKSHRHVVIESPVGYLRLIATAKGLQAILWQGKSRHPRQPKDGQADPEMPILRQAACQLNEYFSKKRTDFDLPLDLRGTNFQLSVWRALRDIPFGETTSYLHLAQLIGHPKAYRAVGMANSCNPIPIIVPCHRVIRSNGSLAGFSQGRTHKMHLLRHEGVSLD